jgi:hypothetical protein
VIVVNTAEKFGADDCLERSWDLPPEAYEPLRAHVEVTSDGWVVDVLPMTAQLAVTVQPWIDEPIDVGSHRSQMTAAMRTRLDRYRDARLAYRVARSRRCLSRLKQRSTTLRFS